MRWVGLVAHMGQVHTGFWWGKLRERGHLDVLGIDGRLILKWSLKPRMGSGYGLIWFRIGKSGSLLCTVMKLQVP